MDIEQAEDALADAELVAFAEAPVEDAKQLRALCLAADIPVAIGRGDCCGSSGCGTKLHLLARTDDVPRVAALMRQRWIEMAEREGTLAPERFQAPAGPIAARVESSPDPDGEPPCPACGSTAALVEGACAGCGLQLE